MRVRKITKTWMLLVGTVVLCLTGCGKETQTADFSGVTSVCELATLKCYYHNVAKAETEASGIFAKWLKTGYKKIWTEYSGIIEYGIDISQVTVSEPDKNGVVTVTMPDAQVLNVDVDEDSLGTPADRYGFSDQCYHRRENNDTGGCAGSDGAAGKRKYRDAVAGKGTGEDADRGVHKKCG